VEDKARRWTVKEHRREARNAWIQKPPRPVSMRELIRSNDPVFLSWIVAMLAGEGIEAVVLDGHTSILEGSISAIPRRVMVVSEDYEQSRRLLEDAGELPPERR
jgi:hypothetical protein